MVSITDLSQKSWCRRLGVGNQQVAYVLSTRTHHRGHCRARPGAATATPGPPAHRTIDDDAHHGRLHLHRSVPAPRRL